MFGLPVLLLSPYAGRLVDRRGSRAFIVIGSILPAAMGLVYSRMTDPTFAVPLIMVEATGFAMLNPALYAVVAANSPVGRSSTAQGLFGAAGTVGFIVASLIAGALAPANIVYPMYVFAAFLTVTLVLGFLIGEASSVGARTPQTPPPVSRFDRKSVDRQHRTFVGIVHLGAKTPARLKPQGAHTGLWWEMRIARSHDVAALAMPPARLATRSCRRLGCMTRSRPMQTPGSVRSS